ARSRRHRRLDDRSPRRYALPARRYTGIGRPRPPDWQRPRERRSRSAPAWWGWALIGALRRPFDAVPSAIPVAAAFLALAVVMTWPLARLSHPSLPDWEDSQFNVWRLAWVAHQLKTVRRPLFDTNVFYPATNTLAYSDAMLFLGVCATPLIWIGIHPFVVHNLAV